jgi:hypothetical protein
LIEPSVYVLFLRNLLKKECIKQKNHTKKASECIFRNKGGNIQRNSKKLETKNSIKYWRYNTIVKTFDNMVIK